MHFRQLWQSMIATIWSNGIWPMPMGLHASPASDLVCLISHEALCSSEAVQMVSFSDGLFLDVRFNCQGRSLYNSTLIVPQALTISHSPAAKGWIGPIPAYRLPCAATQRLEGIFAVTVAHSHCPAGLHTALDGPSERFPSVGILSR